MSRLDDASKVTSGFAQAFAMSPFASKVQKAKTAAETENIRADTENIRADTVQKLADANHTNAKADNERAAARLTDATAELRWAEARLKNEEAHGKALENQKKMDELQSDRVEVLQITNGDALEVKPANEEFPDAEPDDRLAAKKL